MKSAPIFLAAAVALATPALTADEDALVDDDIEFAESLARYQYFGLALDVVQRVRSDSLSNDLEGEAVLTEARIYKRYSEATADPDELARNQDRAIELLYDWRLAGSDYAFHPRRPDALQDLAELLRERGVRFKQAAETSADPEGALDQARSDFEDADEVFETLRIEAEARADQLREQGNADAAEEFATIARNTELYRGINYIEWSDIAPDGEFKLEQAVDAFDNFTWELPDEGMLIGYVSLQYQALALQKLGARTSDQELVVEAIDIYDQCIEELTEYFWTATGEDADGDEFRYWDILGPGQRSQVAAVTADSYSMKAQLLVDLGRVDDSATVMREMQALHDRNDQPLGRRGHQALLDWVVALDEAGHAAKGLEAVKRIAQEGSGTAEGERAARLLSNLNPEVVAQSGSPSVLVTLASTFRKDKRYDDAAFTYLKVVNGELDDTERDEYLIDSWLGAASALRQSGRYLESGLAYERAVDELAAMDDLDDRAKGQLESASGGLYRAFDLNYKQTGHPFDKRLRDDAREKLISMGLADADLQFNAAKESFDEADLLSRSLTDNASEADREAVSEAYIAAIGELESVDAGAPSYERALVYIGRSHRGAGDPDTAIGYFDQVLARAEDSSLTPTDPRGRTRREQAVAEATYWKAMTQFEDLDAPQAALATLADIESEAPTQSSFHELAKYQRVVFHASLGNAEEAQAAYDDLTETFSESSRIGGASFYLASALYEESERRTDEAEVREYKSRAADAMWTYVELSNYSSFANTLRAADWLADVERLDDARSAYETMLGQFDGRVSVVQLDDVRQGLAETLNKQREFGEARQLWKGLLERNPRSPSILAGAARSFGGWLEMDASGNVVEVSGSGDYDDAFDIWAELKKGFDRSAKFEEPWWEAKLQTIYTLYRRGASEPKFLANARMILDNQKNFTPDYDRDTMDQLPEDKRYDDLYRPYFQYLERKVPTN